MRKRPTKDITISRKRCRRTRTHTRTLTRKKTEEPHQAKEHFFFMISNLNNIFIFLGVTFNMNETFNNKQTNKRGFAKDECGILSKETV
jgi:hypothetical protein